MTKFIVEFWYATDLRWAMKVSARDQVHALVLALTEVDPDGWPAKHPFELRILVDDVSPLGGISDGVI